MPKGSVNGQTGYPTLKRPATLDHLNAKERPWRIVEVCLSQAAMHALEDAEDAFDRASLAAERAKAGESEREALRTAEARMNESKQAVDAALREMLFVSVGKEAYNAVITAHTSTPEPTAETPDPPPVIDHDEVNVAIIVASCKVPELTEDDVRRYEREWNPVEFQKLLAAAVDVNTTSRLVELGKGNSRPLMAVSGRG